MDDEQGPWWTRPPEPGPQAPALRRKPNGQPDVDAEVPPGAPAANDFAPPANYPPPDYPLFEATTPAGTDFAPATDYAPGDFTRPAAYGRSAPTDPGPEAPAVPKPPPVVRRVAVVPPAPRPVSPNSAAQPTETLPAISDDIFATFSGPVPSAPTSPSPRAGTHQPAADGGAKPADAVGMSPLARLQQVQMPEPRVMLLGAAGSLVVLLIVLVALASGRGTDTAAPGVNPVTDATATSVEALVGKDPDGLAEVGAADAATQLRQAGQTGAGSIVEAWGWTDKNGRNLVVTSRAGRKGNRSLRVTHLAGLDGDPRVLRVLRDPNLPANCRRVGFAGFTAKSLIVRDLDSNNVAEVLVGWSSRCGGKAASSVIKLALITNGDKYIVRGQGVIGKAADPDPDPSASGWPDGFYKVVNAQYSKLYG